MKFRGNSRRGGKSDNKKDNRERSHLKAFGNAHPVNDTETKLKIRIVKEEDDDKSNKRWNSRQKDEDVVEEVEEFVSPFQNLLTDLNKEASTNKAIANLKRKLEALRSGKKDTKKGKIQRNDKESAKGSNESDAEEDDSEFDDEDDDEDDEEDDEEEDEDNEELDMESAVNTLAQEVLCKDNLETEEKIALGNEPFL